MALINNGSHLSPTAFVSSVLYVSQSVARIQGKGTALSSYWRDAPYN